MDEEKQVANTEEKATPAVEPTPPQTTEKSTPEDVGAGVKKEPVEASDRLDKHPRFQEVIKEKNDLATKIREYEAREAEKKYQSFQEPQKTDVQDPYAGMSAEEKEQTRAFVDKFVKPEVRKEYEPFIQRYQSEQLNKQIGEAKQFVSKYGIDFDEKLPEIVDYLSRPENKGRLTASEAVRNLYFDQIAGHVKTETAEGISKEKEELMEKKKQANTQVSSVSPSAVVQSDEMARQKMSKNEKLHADIKSSIELARKGEKNPKVRTTSGDNLYSY